MREGPETEVGNEGNESAGKVVRLPRDWLGPRERLVPFGSPSKPQAEPEEIEAETSAAGPEPSADAFWGEDSAAIHHALEAPVGDGAPPEAARPHEWRTWIAQLPHRRLVASGVLATAAAVLAVALLVPGSVQRISSRGARLNIAAILNDGVAQISRVHLPRIASTHLKPPVRVAHRVVHRAPRIVAVRRHTSSPAPTYAARVSAATATPLVHSSESTPITHTSAPTNQSSSTRSASSAAAVTPTGQSGALGPISSPNG